MYLNQFSVRIAGGHERPGGYVEIVHCTQYSLVLRNNRNVSCDAKVRIDGKHVGTWRIVSNHSITIERPGHDTGRFTFYLAGSVEAAQAGLVRGDPNLGLVSVTFTPEKQPRPLVSTFLPPLERWESTALTAATTQSLRSAGGTGLSGQSYQHFTSVAALNYDYDQQTTINLRLVGQSQQDTPRPLTMASNPVPPLVE